MKISEGNRLRILYFLVFSCTASWLPIFADYLKDRGLPGVRIGIILSITPLMMFLIQPFYGMMADRIGYKKCLVWSSLLCSISYVLYLSDGGFIYLFGVTVFMSVFYNTIQPLLDSFSLKLAASDPTFSYGRLRIAGAAGWAVMGTLAGYYIDSIDTTVIFVFSAISMFLTFVVSIFLKPDLHDKSVKLETHSFKDIRFIFSNRTLLFLLICVMMVSVGSSTIYYFYSIYMKENGASASLVGYAISLQGLCELPLFYFSAKIIRKLGMKTTLLVTVFTTALRMLLYAGVKDPEAAIWIETLHGISWSLFWVVCVEYVNVLVKENWRATGQSLLYAAFLGAGAILGNLWTGYLYGTQMKIADVFLINAGLVLLIGIVIWIFMGKPNVEKNF